MAAILSKLDRGADLSWLSDRPAVQAALAEALGCPIADLRSGAEPIQPLAGGRKLRLDDARYARAIDLLEETLCPGIPDRVLSPARWSRMWWIARGGSGRTLAGSWLAARGLAEFVSARDWSAAAGRLPGTGAVFVELWGDDIGEAPPEASSLERVCVASSTAPLAPDAWQLLQSPEPAQFVDDLAAWLAARLPPDSAFDAARAVDWIRRGPMAEGLVDTLGTALGLLGALDELELLDPRSKRASDLALVFVRSRLDAAAEPGGASAAWLRRSAFEVLVNIGRQLLTESDQPWDEPRSYDAWLDLVPAEHRRGPDLEWLRLSLADSGGKLRASDIEQTARRLPPGAFRIVRAFQAAGIFAPAIEPDTFVIRPRWLGRVIVAEAAAGLARGSPFEWGEALLRPPAAPAVATRVLSRIVSDDAMLGEALELGADESPAYVAALEMLVRSAGLALIGGAELGVEDLETLWNEQARLLFDCASGPPRPRVDFPDQVVEQAPALGPGIWLLAALALTEPLPPASGARHPLLRPWLSRRPPQGLRAVLDAIAASLEAESARKAFALGAVILIDRLRNVLGSVAEDGGGVHRLELPGVVLDEVEHGVLDWRALQSFELYSTSLEIAFGLAERRGRSPRDLARALWSAWEAAGCPETQLFRADGPAAPLLFAHAPGPLLERMLASLAPSELRIAGRHFGDEQWQAFVRSAAAGALGDRSLTGVLESIGRDHAQQLIGEDSALEDSSSLALLWSRFPAVVAAAVRARLERGGERARPLIDAAPLEHTAKVVDLVRERLLTTATSELSPRALEHVRKWLHGRIRARAPAWREAYAVLAEIERRLAPVLKARHRQ